VKLQGYLKKPSKTDAIPQDRVASAKMVIFVNG
jgi:hypothetical protein